MFYLNSQGLNGALDRAFRHYVNNSESWQQLVQKVMRIDLSWDSSALQYEKLYEKSGQSKGSCNSYLSFVVALIFHSPYAGGSILCNTYSNKMYQFPSQTCGAHETCVSVGATCLCLCEGYMYITLV